MHSYATDSTEREKIPFYMAVLSILVSWGLYETTAPILSSIPLPWLVNAPSVMGLYALFYRIFDKYLWRKEFFQKIGLVSLPDLNGAWEGHISSSFDNHEVKKEATLNIRQSWTQISIILETENSRSSSLMTIINTNNPNEIDIHYEYLNEPMSDAINTMHTHRGTAKLTFIHKDRVLKGDYYSGRSRQNIGVLYFKRKDTG